MGEQLRASAAALLVRDVCELERADPDQPDTVCIGVEDLERIVARHVSNVPVIDLEQEAYRSIMEVATKAAWLPKEYMANDIVADILAWLREVYVPGEDFGVALIAEERRNEVEQDGFLPAMKLSYANDELVLGAKSYLATAMGFDRETAINDGWPWDQRFFKPESRARDLVRAGALIAAELTRMKHAGEIEAVSAKHDPSNPDDPYNGSTYHSGVLCVEGCGRPAGTAWSPHWCQPCNAERMARISTSLEGVLKTFDAGNRRHEA